MSLIAIVLNYDIRKLITTLGRWLKTTLTASRCEGVDSPAPGYGRPETRFGTGRLASYGRCARNRHHRHHRPFSVRKTTFRSHSTHPRSNASRSSRIVAAARRSCSSAACGIRRRRRRCFRCQTSAPCSTSASISVGVEKCHPSYDRAARVRNIDSTAFKL